jgi:signal-transduction protein with cAMP-binding, CBS, and nucleotidyltransferase domain
MHRFIIPDVIQEHPVQTLKGGDSAFLAANTMKESNIAAVLIIDDDGKLQGIVTERDLTRRIIAAGLDPSKTPLADIMTANPNTLDPSDSVRDAMKVMRTGRLRHLPVKKGNKIIGMVSIRDLFAAIQADLEDNIKETEAFVFGDRYSA